MFQSVVWRPAVGKSYSRQFRVQQTGMGNRGARGRAEAWSLADDYRFIAGYVNGEVRDSRSSVPRRCSPTSASPSHLPHRHGSRSLVSQRRGFHDYFVTNLPSSSLHPDSRPPSGPHHKLPRAASSPHTGQGGASPLAPPPTHGSREMTVVRIPLVSAKHHFGVSLSRGTRPYNEDSYQAGVIELPAFAKKAPISLTWARKEEGVGQGAESASGDPQVFYFGVFDGHGGAECSNFLREELHNYIEESAREFELGSSLRRKVTASPEPADPSSETSRGKAPSEQPQASLDSGAKPSATVSKNSVPPPTAPSVAQHVNKNKALDLEFRLVNRWKDLVGGYYRRFKPEHFSLGSGGRGHPSSRSAAPLSTSNGPPTPTTERIGIESVLMYAFLHADLDFITAQSLKTTPLPTSSSHAALHPDRALNEHDILDRPSMPPPHIIGGDTPPFKGGSTASIALISTPTPTPFWHPATPCTLLTAHVGDTKLLLCHTATGSPVPLTTPHHPSRPTEISRLRRYAPFFSTDSFGEERLAGLANTRAFGDYNSKPHGVSAEPDIRRLELRPAEYAFLTLLSDGVADVLSDQEVVDLVKEARTPEQAARDVVTFAVEVGAGDNATAVVVRLGGWERRAEGGVGSLGTREVRELRRREAADPRRGRT